MLSDIKIDTKCLQFFSFRWFLIYLITTPAVGQTGNFSSRIGKKNILFGLGNWAEFGPQISEIKSPGHVWKTKFQALGFQCQPTV